MAGLRLNSAPASEPVTTAEMRDQLRLGSVTTFDTELDRLVTAAREVFEADTGRALITQTWDLFRDSWPTGTREDGILLVPRPNLLTVVHVTYVDDDGNTTYWTDDGLVGGTPLYRVDTNSTPGRITPAFGESFPDHRHLTNGINVQFTAGYGANASDVPQRIRHAIRMLAAYYWNQNRDLGLCISAQAAEAAMQAYKRVVAHNKVWWFH